MTQRPRVYTAREAMQELGIDSRQYERLLEIAGISPETPAYDRRLRLITHTQLQLLALQREQMLGVDAPRDALAEIDALRERVAALEARLTAESAPTAPTPPLEDWVLRDHFAELHGVNMRTAKNHVLAGHIAETQRPIPNRNQVSHLLTPVQQHAAVVWWRAHYAKFRPCAECPHEQ